MKTLRVILLTLIFSSTYSIIHAQEWQKPAVKDYGKVKLYDDAAMMPDKNIDYKIVFQLNSDETKEDVNAGLWHMARTMNLLKGSGVPDDHIHLVGVISGKATPVVMSNKAYQKKNGKDNPDIKLMKELSDNGAKLYVCGQAAAEHQITEKDLNDYVVFTLSALIDIPEFQYKGYALMP